MGRLREMLLKAHPPKVVCKVCEFMSKADPDDVDELWEMLGDRTISEDRMSWVFVQIQTDDNQAPGSSSVRTHRIKEHRRPE